MDARQRAPNLASVTVVSNPSRHPARNASPSRCLSLASPERKPKSMRAIRSARRTSVAAPRVARFPPESAATLPRCATCPILVRATRGSAPPSDALPSASPRIQNVTGDVPFAVGRTHHSARDWERANTLDRGYDSFDRDGKHRASVRMRALRGDVKRHHVAVRTPGDLLEPCGGLLDLGHDQSNPRFRHDRTVTGLRYVFPHRKRAIRDRDVPWHCASPVRAFCQRERLPRDVPHRKGMFSLVLIRKPLPRCTTRAPEPHAQAMHRKAAEDQCREERNAGEHDPAVERRSCRSRQLTLPLLFYRRSGHIVSEDISDAQRRNRRLSRMVRIRLRSNIVMSGM